jgi:hypothetical protein
MSVKKCSVATLETNYWAASLCRQVVGQATNNGKNDLSGSIIVQTGCWSGDQQRRKTNTSLVINKCLLQPSLDVNLKRSEKSCQLLYKRPIVHIMQ